MAKYKGWVHSAAVGYLAVAAFLATHESYLSGHPKLEATANIATALAGLVSLYVKAEK